MLFPEVRASRMTQMQNLTPLAPFTVSVRKEARSTHNVATRISN